MQQLKQKKEEKSQNIQKRTSKRDAIIDKIKKNNDQKKIKQDKSYKNFHDNQSQAYKQDPKSLLCDIPKDDDDNLLENINDRTGLFDKAKDQCSFFMEESKALNYHKHKSQEQKKNDNEHSQSKSWKKRHSTNFINKTHRDLSVNEIQNTKSTYNLKDNEKFTFTPKLSKKSLMMAKKLGKSRDRLTRESLIQAFKKREKLKDNIENEFSFKPTINKKSEMLISRKIDYDQKTKWEILHEHVKIKFSLIYMKFYNFRTKTNMKNFRN